MAWRFLKENKNVRTVVEKVKGFSGELRTLKTKHLAGEKTKEATYKENGCIFRFNIDEVYFSERLSNERKTVSEEILRLIQEKKSSKILVMFSGVGPFPIVLAKEMKRQKIKGIIYSNELNKKAAEYQEKNIVSNKVSDYIRIVDGDAKNLPKKIKEKFDVILMPRPNLKETFLNSAISLSKRGTKIFYYGFGKGDEVLEEIKKNSGGKIGGISIRKAGDIGVGIYRWLALLEVDVLRNSKNKE